MHGFKLMRKRKDGTLGSLYFNATRRYEPDKWYGAVYGIEKKGFAYRPGFHILENPEAPHLKQTENRIWVKVEFSDAHSIERPASQGGKWYIADKMKVVEILE